MRRSLGILALMVLLVGAVSCESESSLPSQPVDSGLPPQLLGELVEHFWSPADRIDPWVGLVWTADPDTGEALFLAEPTQRLGLNRGDGLGVFVHSSFPIVVASGARPVSLPVIHYVTDGASAEFDPDMGPTREMVWLDWEGANQEGSFELQAAIELFPVSESEWLHPRCAHIETNRPAVAAVAVEGELLTLVRAWVVSADYGIFERTNPQEVQCFTDEPSSG